MLGLGKHLMDSVRNELQDLGSKKNGIYDMIRITAAEIAEYRSDEGGEPDHFGTQIFW